MKLKKLLSVCFVMLLIFNFTGCSALKKMKDSANEIKELAQQDEKYLKMSEEELCALDDGDLCYAISLRTWEKVSSAEDIEQEMSMLNKKEQIFYALDLLLMEVGNGGLCQFFGNSSSFVAPLISECLETIGAKYHKELYDSFVKDNDIDFGNLNKFTYESENQYSALYEQYPFDEFDEKFYGEIEAFEECLAKFIRNNISSFK